MNEIQSTLSLNSPAFVTEIVDVMERAGYEIYIVGGGVRDILLSREVTDWDLTTNATPEEIQALFSETYYDNDFGTVGVLDPNDVAQHEAGDLDKLPVYEITTFRTEQGYSDNRRPDTVQWGTRLIEDMERRDFTIGALALQRQKGSKTDFMIHDPFGGIQDLQAGVVRAVGDAVARFDEDALRMMRAIRIAAQLGFVVESSTLEAIRVHADRIETIAAERVRDELFKLLISNFARDGVVMLYSTGLMQYILPELLATRGVDQAGHHTLDVWNHSLQSLEHCPSRDPVVLLATLLHDIGKAPTRAFVCRNCEKYTQLPFDEIDVQFVCPRCGTVSEYREAVVFYNHEMAGARMVREIGQRLRLSKKQLEKLVRLVRWHMFSVDDQQTDKAIKRFIRNVGLEYVDDILDLRTGDRLGGGARETSWRLEKFKQRIIDVQQEPLTVHDLKISGNEVMDVLGLKPSPKVGEVMNQLFEAFEDGKVENDIGALREYLVQNFK